MLYYYHCVYNNNVYTTIKIFKKHVPRLARRGSPSRTVINDWNSLPQHVVINDWNSLPQHVVINDWNSLPQHVVINDWNSLPQHVVINDWNSLPQHVVINDWNSLPQHVVINDWNSLPQHVVINDWNSLPQHVVINDWNSLPQHVVNASSMNSYKNKLDEWCLEQQYQQYHKVVLHRANTYRLSLLLVELILLIIADVCSLLSTNIM